MYHMSVLNKFYGLVSLILIFFSLLKYCIYCIICFNIKMCDIKKCFSHVGNECVCRTYSDPTKGIVIHKPSKTREVCGPSGTTGLILREKTGRSSMELMDMKAQKRDIEKIIQTRLEKDKFDDLRASFWDKADSHVLVNKIKGLVDLGMKRYDSDLLDKKNKLKVELLKEEVELTHEFIEKSQRRADDIYEEKKLLANEIEGRQRREGEIHAREAYDRIFKESSDEYKKLTTLENKKYCTKINEFQMRDKILAQMKEKEEDKMWIKLMDKFEKSKAEGITGEYSELDKTKANIKNYGHTDEILLKQIYGHERTKQIEKELKKEEQEFWQGMNEMFKQDDTILKNRDIYMKEQWRNDLLQQIEDNKKKREKEQEEETMFDEMLKNKNEMDLEHEKAQIKDERISERRELDIFKDSVQQFKQSMHQNEKELDTLITEEMKKIENIRKCNRDKARKAREKLMRDVLDSRNRQVRENKEKFEKEKEEKLKLADYSQFRWKQNDDLDKLKEKEVTDDRAKNLQSLMQQEEYAKEVKRRETEEYLEFLTNRKKQMKDYEEKANLLLNKGSEYKGLKHPFIYAFKDGSQC